MKHLTSIQRFWVSFVLVIPMLIQMLAMPFHWNMPGYTWIAFITTTLIMLVAALPYWTSAWAAFKHHNANMNTLVAIGTSIAYFYSLFAMITGRPVYFESAAFISVFVLLGDTMEERMHNNASNALKKLLDLQIKSAEVLRMASSFRFLSTRFRLVTLFRLSPDKRFPLTGSSPVGRRPWMNR